jgi:carbohydrate-selective porin OprB
MKNHSTQLQSKNRWIGLFLAFLSIVSVVNSADISSTGNFFKDWLSQTNGATYGWFGLTQPLKTYGFSATGEAKELFLGQVSGGLPNQPKGNWDGEVKLKFQYDFEPIFGIKGLTAESNWRDRFGGTPQFTAGTYNIFNPTQLTSGTGLRILTQQIEYTTPNKALTINLGWENPYEQFLQQPLSKFFENNAITSAKGIGGAAGPGIIVVNPTANAGGSPVGTTPTKANPVYQGSYNFKNSPVPWGSTYAAWGGTLKLRPIKQVYVQSGLYLAISGTGDTTATQYGPTSVYPYTSIPSSYLGTFKSSGQIVPYVNGAGKVVGTQNVGWVPYYQNNHGFNFQGSPSFNPTTQNLGTGATSAKSDRNSTNSVSNGKYVQGSRFNAASPYPPGNNGSYSQNGLYNVNEIGWEPKFGKSQLEGKYALGSYIWGQNNYSYTPTAFTPSSGTTVSYAARKPAQTQENQVTWGLYLQADQQLFREKSDDPAKLSKQGLYSFNEFTFTPPQNNALPFYFQTGLVYKGLIPHRDDDSAGIALGAGFYSSYYNQYIDSQNQQLQYNYGTPNNAAVPNGPTQYQPLGTTNSSKTYYGGTNQNPPSVTSNPTASPLKDAYAYLPHFSSTEVIEGFYNVQLTKWASLKPGAQYIINPAGNGTIGNEWILQVVAKVTF